MKPRVPWDPTRRVVIPMRVQAGKLVPFYGGEMPRLRDETVVEVVTEVSAFLDPKEAERFDLDDVVEILPADAPLFAVLNLRLDSLHQRAIPRVDVQPIPPLPGEYYLIPFSTREPLRLHLRGTRPAELLPCRCDIRIPAHEDPKSVNEAYSRLSEHYEPWRRSHTGNVFTKVYFTRDGMEAFPLRKLRRETEAKAEARLFAQSGELPLAPSRSSTGRRKR